MKAIMMAGLVVLLAVGGVLAQGSRGSEARSVAGAWDVLVKGPAAHGDLAAAMELQQDGGKVTGTFTAHGNTHKLSGELNGEQLSLEATDTPADKALEFTATLKDDGTLSGYLSGPMGDMTWTASRVKEA